MTPPFASPRARLAARLRALATPLTIAALVAILLLAALVTTPPPEPIPYDLDASHPAGLLALRLWLTELGYDVQRTGGLRFDLPAAADLLFVYPNQLSYNAAEAAALKQWVEQGGTLVLVGPTAEDHALVDAFGVRQAPELSYENEQVQVQPLLPLLPPLPHTPESLLLPLLNLMTNMTSSLSVPVLPAWPAH